MSPAHACDGDWSPSVPPSHCIKAFYFQLTLFESLTRLQKQRKRAETLAEAKRSGMSVVPGPRQRIELRRLLASVSVRNDGISVEQVQGQQGLFASELHNIVLQTRFLHAEHAARNSKLGGPVEASADPAAPFTFAKPEKPPFPSGYTYHTPHSLIDKQIKARYWCAGTARQDAGDVPSAPGQQSQATMTMGRSQPRADADMSRHGQAQSEGLLWDWLEAPAKELALVQRFKWARKENAYNRLGICSPWINRLRSQGMARVETSRQLRLMLYESRAARVSRCVCVCVCVCV